MSKSIGKSYHLIFSLLLFLSFCSLIYLSSTLSVSYKEALNVLDNSSILTYITYPLLYLFPSNDIALRFPFLLFYALSSILMYLITKDYFKYQKDRILNVILFMILPGMISAAVLVNTAIIVLFFLLLYLYYYKIYNKHNYPLLVFCLFIDNSFAILYLALFFYAFEKKNNILFIVSLCLFGISMSIYGFSTNGRPLGHFIDTFAIYASVFSPLLFLYFFYSQYRIAVKGTRSIYWYISFTALILSLLFSFRQKIYIEDFAPFVIIAMPMMLKLFFHTLRVRLKIFRIYHYVISFLTFFILFINYIVIFYNKPIYVFLDKPKKHFLYKYSFVSDLAKELKYKNINYVNSDDKYLLKRLEFYDIKKGYKYFISEDDISNEKIEFKYKNKVIKTYYIK